MNRVFILRERKHAEALTRFWEKVNKLGPNGCWEWLASKTKAGYGQFWLDGTMVYAHRVTYLAMVGPIPDGLQIDHLCRNRGCCNPAHLEPVTPKTNTNRGDAGKAFKAKTHCPKGHEYSDANTRIYQGRRFCRTCSNAFGKRWRDGKKAA